MARRTKLAYILHEIAIGGAEVAFLSALPHLAKEFDLRVYILHKGNYKLIETIPAPLKKHLVFCNIPLFLYPLYVPLLAARILRFKPRYLVCSLWRSCLVGSLVKRLDRSICYFPFVHSSIFFHKFDRWASTWAMRMADAVFVDSLSARDFVANTGNVNNKPISVISFLTAATPRAVPHYNFRQKRFLFVGRLHPVKNLPAAVHLIVWLRKQGVDARLDIYGRDDGDAENVIETIRKGNMGKYIEWKGELLPVEKPQLFVANDYPFYLQLSTAEGMAMSVVEAMQAGKVCVLTTVGEIPHYATDGESAVFVDDSSQEAWERAMRRVLDVITNVENCERMSKAAHRVFRERPLFKDSLIEAIYGGGSSSE